ncbi:hypothetical protein UFOVP784_10 [uncultured Caudovirales phage]|uniref:Uncharacterized protein n=1 Tax=uncultured Caudovirales phage TaxID=2100421 RepID=A0A6J5NSR7_9CAUD|nr:hypothetical protein UFOVP436_10 [uncultured Caudovirales phage]CAB4162003.1 hypothetical protein UFOVP784_10 [uncultured Caudovirales phage]
MKKKSKLWLAIPALFITSLYFNDKALAEDIQPQTVYMYDTELGTESYELLIQYSNGGHSTIGQILKDAGVASAAPGIGFGVGSGGNGYRPNVMIVIWTSETINLEAAKAAIKSFVNVPTNPTTTNGDCAIACDGTVQSEPAPAVQTNENVVEQPVPIQQPEQQEQAPAPQTTPDNTPQYTVPTVTLESFFSYLPSTDVVVRSPIGNKITSNKKIIKTNKITTKKARTYATSKTKR